jgi:hypothetical protein
MIHRTVTENTAARTQFPMLTRTNYQEWVMLMQVNFEAAWWWYAIEPEEGEEVNYRHDHLVLTAILWSVSVDMLSSLRERRSSTAASWEVIKRIHVSVQHVCEANMQKLRWEFGALVWKESENAEDFVNRITGLAAELRQLGDNISNVEVVPEHLSQVAISIETLLNINCIAIKEVTRMFHAVEHRRKPALVLDSHGHLLLCEEWMGKLKLHESEDKGGRISSGSASGKKCGARSKGYGCSNGDSAASSSCDGSKFESGSGSAPTKKDRCK